MNPALLLVSSGFLFAVLPQAWRMGALLGSIVPVLFAVGFAVAASGRTSGIPVAAGAIAALLGGVIAPVIPAIGGALLVGVVYAERGTRVRARGARVLHGVLSVAAGAAAGCLAFAYSGRALAEEGVAVVLTAVLASAPLLVDADDPRAALLEAAAIRLGPPIRVVLLEAVELLRCADVHMLDAETRGNVKRTWKALERLVQARLRLEEGAAQRQGGAGGGSGTATMVAEMVDKQIEGHVMSLRRAYTASAAKGAAEVGLDDDAVRSVDARGEVLEEQSRAIVEVKSS